MDSDDDFLCSECVSDPVLRQWMLDNGRAGECSFCEEERIVCPVSQVADKIDEAIRKFYRPGTLMGHVVSYSDNIQYWEEGEPATQIIQEIAGVEPEIAEAIDELLHEAEWRDIRDGGTPTTVAFPWSISASIRASSWTSGCALRSV